MNVISPEIIDTPKQICDLVDWIVSRRTASHLHSPILYIDLEGVNLSRDGSLSIFTLLINIGNSACRICLIDVHTLGASAFNSAGLTRETFKGILQDERILKVFFDVRNDSDALFAHFGVALQGVEDVQLMESATRKTTASRKFLSGLAKCIENNLRIPLSRSEIARWKTAKSKGERLFKAERGGSPSVFNQRPIAQDIILYCVGDVQYLPRLRENFYPQISRCKELISEHTKERIAASQRPGYQPHGREKAVAPWNAQQNTVLNQVHGNVYRSHIDDWDDFFEYNDYDDCEDWYDDGPTSGRDIINDCDYHLYYSD